MSADDLMTYTPAMLDSLRRAAAPGDSVSTRPAPTASPSALDSQIGGDHYRQGGIQPVQYIEANALGFLEGCVVKRLTRHNRPTGKGLQDIDKAIHELQLLRELRYGGETK